MAYGRKRKTTGTLPLAISYAPFAIYRCPSITLLPSTIMYINLVPLAGIEPAFAD